ncbi:MAG: hypothetical protein AUJ97_02565 [Bacteroidetes bacterium CG2_30_32_10]|nr:MAG: hypothetical protein AUJ97_02565 [Bacteroidetes bacterium CG2_30_32_10]
MSYYEDYWLLKNRFNINDKHIVLENGINIYNQAFISENDEFLPQIDDFSKDNDGNFLLSQLNTPYQHQIIDIDDGDIVENKSYQYTIFTNSKAAKSKKIIVLFHGLNEKDWTKYLPWAKRLVEQTDSAVVLFPIAFHMNRTPAAWSDQKIMNKVSDERKKMFPNIVDSSFANAAISTRLQYNPQHFFWSGLESYCDFIQLFKLIRNGKCAHLDKDASINIFSYSVGSMLAEIILFTNENNWFSKTKLFIFCGGATFNRMLPVSKYILDSEANIALYAYFIEHLEKELARDHKLSTYFQQVNSASYYFKSMLDYHKMKENRNIRLDVLKSNIAALVLKKDTVVPAYEVVNFLKGEDRKRAISVKIMDFPFNYRHEAPFPFNDKIKNEVNKAFDYVFNFAAKHLS